MAPPSLAIFSTTVEFLEYQYASSPGKYIYCAAAERPTLESFQQQCVLIPTLNPTTTSFEHSTVGLLDCFSNLESHLPVSSTINLGTGSINNILEQRSQLPNIMLEIREFTELYAMEEVPVNVCNTSDSDDIECYEQRSLPYDQNKDELENEAEEEEEKLGKNVYRAKEGYLVEEPDDSSEDDKPSKVKS